MIKSALEPPSSLQARQRRAFSIAKDRSMDRRGRMSASGQKRTFASWRIRAEPTRANVG